MARLLLGRSILLVLDLVLVLLADLVLRLEDDGGVGQ